MLSKTVICLRAETMDELLSLITRMNSVEVDILEIRADFLKVKYLTKSNLQLIRNTTKKQLIFTLRKREEGGSCNLKEEQRYSLFLDAIEIGFEFIDIENSSIKYQKDLLRKKQDAKIILSHHNFTETDPLDVATNYSKMCAQKIDVIKIATMARSINDNTMLLNLLKRHPDNCPKLTCFCMGNKGKDSRILGYYLGNYLTYLAYSSNQTTASGQLTYKEFSELVN